MTVPEGPQPPTIRVPRWIQLVGLPVALLLVWMLVGVLGQVLFLFLTASVIAFLLNPLVRDLKRLRLPRGLAVAVVFLVFATAVGFIVLALGSVLWPGILSAVLALGCGAGIVAWLLHRFATGKRTGQS